MMGLTLAERRAATEMTAIRDVVADSLHETQLKKLLGTKTYLGHAVTVASNWSRSPK